MMVLTGEKLNVCGCLLRKGVCKLTGCHRTSVWWNKVLFWALMAFCSAAVVKDSLTSSCLLSYAVAFTPVKV